jgi:hypothetical protein
MSISPKASRPGDVRAMPAIGIAGGISQSKRRVFRNQPRRFYAVADRLVRVILTVVLNWAIYSCASITLAASSKRESPHHG